MALILPKGVFVNSPDISGSIERINTEPLDLAEIAKFWKVYTTTKRRLLDPTAERLENYWWRIWGSSRRELKGATVAHLFAQISDGPTCVPLRGPPNRDEGSHSLKHPARLGPGASSNIALSHLNPQKPSTTISDTSNRSLAVMPHPILKKTKGPTTAGPKPTARFISPHESENEAPTSSVSPNSHVIVQPPSPDPKNSRSEKKAAPVPSSKKFVASKAGKKKRPVIARRQSSQTSQSSSESATRSFEGPQIGNQLSSADTVPSVFAGEDKLYYQEPGELSLGSAAKRSHMSSVAAEKGYSQNTDSRGEPLASISEHGKLHNPRLRSGEVDLADNQQQGSLNKGLNTSAKSSEEYSPEHHTLPSQRGSSQSSRGSSRSFSDGRLDSRSSGALRCLVTGETKSSPSLAQTLAEVTGQLEIGKEPLNVSSVGPTPRTSKSKGKHVGDSSNEDLFVKRPVVAAEDMTVSEADTLKRSKSQLTQLLEKDRMRAGKQSPSEAKNKKSQE